MSSGKRRKGTVNTGNAASSLLTKADSLANDVLRSSRQLYEYNYGGDIIQPPYEPKELIALIERNDTLKQNIKALAANVANFGFGIKYQDDFDYNKAREEVKKEADAEWETLRRLYKYVNPLTDFNSLIYKAAIDLYSFGWGMLEIIRNGAGGVCGIEYCRACNFRLAKSDSPRTSIKVWEETDAGFEQVENTVMFKKFVQTVNGKKVYFKEFGDPRPMSCVTGGYGEHIPEDERATEIAYFRIHSSYTDYGVPSWINVSVAASGNILSEILNYNYFHDGKILPTAIVVSGGQLTESSVQAIKNSKGIDNAYKALILEAAPFEDDETERYTEKENKSRVSIDIKSLTDTHNSDALFSNYQKEGREKIRDSLRLPPIYTGASSDYNRATADTARQIAEEQIFVPERKRVCNVFNKIINNEKRIRYCEVYLKAPDLSDISQKANIINALNSAGAVTPNMLLPLAEELLGKDIELWDEELGNVPFELIKLKLQQGDNYKPNSGNEAVAKSDEDIIDELSRLTEAIRAELGGGQYE